MKTPCKHCGTSFKPSPKQHDFCCSGCQFVYALIHEQGLDTFYKIKDATVAPVSPHVFQASNSTWLEALIQEAEQKKPDAPSLTLEIQGISCTACVWLIDRIFKREPGGLKIEIQPSNGRLEISWTQGAFNGTHFAHTLQSLGYRLGRPGDISSKPGVALITRLGLCGAFALNAMLFTLPGYLGMDASFAFALLFEKLTCLFASLSVLVGATYFIKRAIRSLKQGVLHMDLPIALGIIVAYTGSFYAWIMGKQDLMYFDFVSLFIFLMLLGRWIQEITLQKNRSRLLSYNPEPQKVAYWGTAAAPKAKNEMLSVEALAEGDTYSLSPGETVPVLSRLLSDHASLSFEWINGEPEAQTADKTQTIPAGAVNISTEPLKLEARQPWAESLLARLLKQSPTTQLHSPLLEKVLKRYIFGVLGIALISGSAWAFLANNIDTALQVFISVLIVSCPCAIGLALPLAEEMAIASLRKCGVYIKNATLLMRLRALQTIFFDKTGTLTLETLELKDAAQLSTLPLQTQKILFSLVANNLHPVSRSLREALLLLNPSLIHAHSNNETQEMIGFGLWTQKGAHTWSLGRPGWGAQLIKKESTQTPNIPLSEDCELCCDGKPIAHFSFNETVRQDAIAEITNLKKRGLSIHILSGDRQEKISALAKALGLNSSHAHGALSPEEKAHYVTNLDEDNTLMIGDGANDSLAFDAAFTRGTPVIDKGLLEHKADFYFLGTSLSGITRLIETSQKRKRCISTVFAFSLMYNIAAVGLCVSALMTPLLAAVIMPLSSIVSLGIVAGFFRPAR